MPTNRDRIAEKNKLDVPSNMSVTEPTDAPFGPIARWLARNARRALIGDEKQSGGILGHERLSPRLEGWIQKAGFDDYSLSRYVEGATSWATADPKDFRAEANNRIKEQHARYCSVLKPLFELVILDGHPNGKMLTKHFVLKESYEILVDCYAGDADKEILAQRIRDSNVLPDPLPVFGTFEGWFRGTNLEALIK